MGKGPEVVKCNYCLNDSGVDCDPEPNGKRTKHDGRQTLNGIKTPIEGCLKERGVRLADVVGTDGIVPPRMI